jgi:hypothetical protein
LPDSPAELVRHDKRFRELGLDESAVELTLTRKLEHESRESI